MAKVLIVQSGQSQTSRLFDLWEAFDLCETSKYLNGSGSSECGQAAMGGAQRLAKRQWHKLKHRKFHTDMRKDFFTVMVTSSKTFIPCQSEIMFSTIQMTLGGKRELYLQAGASQG